MVRIQRIEQWMDWQGALTAMGVGVVLGVIRERRPHADESKAGLRTHVLVSILGYLAWGLGPWTFLAVLAVVGALVLTGYRASVLKDPGLTGEMALLVTLLLSAWVHLNPTMAVGLGVLVASLLEFKQLSHRFTREWITQQELQDTLVLAVAALVVMPLLPDRTIDPWNVLRPMTLWRIVVLVMAVGMVGHLVQRVLGLRWGLPVAGFFSGFVSSTAALAHLGHQVRKDPGLTLSASAAALLSNLASLLLMMAVVGAVSPTLLRAVAWPMTASCAGLLGVALWYEHAGAPPASASIQLSESAFKLSHALLFAVVMGGVTLLSVGLQALWGDAGVWVTATLVALLEVHAAAASVAQMRLDSSAPVSMAAWTLVAVLTSSAAAKTFLAFFTGGAAFGFRVSLGLGVMVLVAGLTLLLN